MKKFNFSPGGGAGNDQGGSARVRRRARSGSTSNAEEN